MAGATRSVAIALLMAVAIGCGGADRAQRRAADSSIEDLRFRIVKNPRDGVAHRALGQQYRASGMSGASLRHLRLAHRLGAIGREAGTLATMHLDRAANRYARGDFPGALADLEAAIELRPKAVRPEVRVDILAGAALAEYRRGGRFGTAAGDAVLARVRDDRPDDDRLVLLSKDDAPLADFARAAAWLADGGAKRVAFERYATYVERGGRDMRHLSRYIALHRWWFGQSRPLPAVLAKRGALPCTAARSFDEHGCAAWFADHWSEPAGAATARRAHESLWSSSHPDVVAAVIGAATDAWLSRDAALEQDLPIELLPVINRIGEVPLFARSTVLRLAGQQSAADGALRDALETVQTLSPARRRVVLMELAVRGQPEQLLAVSAAARTDSTEATLWYRAARRADAPAGVDHQQTKVIASMSRPLAGAVLRSSGELAAVVRLGGDDLAAAAARLGLAQADAVLAGDSWAEVRNSMTTDGAALVAAHAAASAPALRAAPINAGVIVQRRAAVSDATVAVAAELSRIAAEYVRAPAVADRLTQQFVDHPIDVGQRAPLVVEMFWQLGDVSRAKRWAESLLATSPLHPDYLMLAGEANAAAGLNARADVLFVRGAARSGDAGAANLRAARAFHSAGAHAAAVGALKRALATTAPGEDIDALHLLGLSLLELSRESNLEATRRTLEGRFPIERRLRVRARFPEIFRGLTEATQSPSRDALAIRAALEPRSLDLAAQRIRAGAANPRRIAGDAVHAAALFATRRAWSAAAAALDAVGDQASAERARTIAASLPRTRF